MPEPADSDGIELLADALWSYLAEVESYSTICRRHQGTAGVKDTGAGVRVSQYVPAKERIITSLRSSVGMLPGWEKTPFWSSEGKRWKRLHQGLEAKLQGQAGLRIIGVRGIGWEEHPLLVSACVSVSDALLRVDLWQLPVPTDLPELPLRTVARILRCHEHILPASVAFAVPFPPDSEALAVEEYLRRATPQNLCASQCFWLSGAER